MLQCIYSIHVCTHYGHVKKIVSADCLQVALSGPKMLGLGQSFVVIKLGIIN